MQLDTLRNSPFQYNIVPENSRLVGWAALAQALSLRAPVRRPGCVSDRYVRGSRRKDGTWWIYDQRYWPGDTIADHLLFALRHEDLDLLVLKRAFDAMDALVVEELVRTAPTGVAPRRIWFLYELLTGETLDLPDASGIAAVDVLDPKLYFTAGPELSRRHRVRNNLLGTSRFCPVIRRTLPLTKFVDRALSEKARRIVGRTGAHFVTRAASFLLLADSRASFEIEGERPPRNRLERWGRAVLEAGRHELTLEEIVRLHHILIEDARFTVLGLRPDGVFLGERDHHGEPVPEFIGARPEDLLDLVHGLIAANARMGTAGLDAVLQAAATAFAFVYIHPLQDGNGRLHRCLVHHVLAGRGFTPPGMVFPVSSVMLDRIGDYRGVLQVHTSPLMPCIDWRSTPQRNVEVLNDTADLYRYFDCTDAAEFLYSCVARTVDEDLPHEIDYLRRHEEAMRRMMNTVEMPDNLARNLIMFIRQNGGALPNKRRRREFQALTDEEVEAAEAIVAESFDGFPADRDRTETGDPDTTIE